MARVANVDLVLQVGPNGGAVEEEKRVAEGHGHTPTLTYNRYYRHSEASADVMMLLLRLHPQR